MTSEAGEKEKNTPALTLGEVTGAGAFAVGLASAWLYVTGWTYAYHYFDRFGIPLLMVDIPKENYFVYGGIVMHQFLIWELAAATIVITLILLKYLLRLDVTRFRLPLGAVIVPAAFWIGHQMAVVAAHKEYVRQRESDYNAFPRVQVWLKESAASTDGSPRSSVDLTKGCYRLVLHNQDRLFLVRPSRGAQAASLPTLVAPWEQVTFARVLPDYTSCE